MNCQRVPLQWPQNSKLIQILDELEVDYPEAIEIIGRLNIFKPYLLQIDYTSQFDFIYVLNGLMTRLVFTPPEEWDAFVSKMVAAICESENLTDNYNNVRPSASTEDPSIPDASSIECGDNDEAVGEGTDCLKPFGPKTDGLISDLPVTRPEQEAATGSSTSQETLQRQIKQKSKSRSRRTRMSNHGHSDHASSQKSTSSVNKEAKLVANAIKPPTHDSRTINDRMENLNDIRRLNAGEHKRRVLDAKYRFFRTAEVIIPKDYDPMATELLILQKLTTHLADTDWIWFKDIDKRIQRLAFRILDRRK